MLFRLVIFFFVLAVHGNVISQSLPAPRNIRKAYQNGTRSADGKPGKNYWQNSASYQIDVQVDPVSRLLKGSVEMVYTNNSPDTLKQIWFKLYPNLYKAGTPRLSKIAAEDLSEGLILDSVWINGAPGSPALFRIDGTNMTLDSQSVAKGKTITFRMTYHYTINKGSHVRTGEVEPGALFVAYFFPRIAVYDDTDGWNKNPYNGTQEFYNDFCRFDARITLPRNYVVWATGDLQNSRDVLRPEYIRRVRLAENSDTVVTVIDTTDDRLSVTTDHDFLTWHYRAADVTDFVFATSDHYIWKATSVEVDRQTHRRTRVDAVFNPSHKDYFEVVGDAQKTVDLMSHFFPQWPFPYPHMTVFDGLDQMEYPMMVNDNPVEDRAESIELTDHEIFHTMFPFYMGTNETKYAWMDEGWATIGEWLLSPMIDTSIVDEYGVRPYELHAGTEVDLPLNTLSTLLSGTAYFLNAYPKPAFAYLYVKDMLGDRLFTTALHSYIRQWKGKHPLPFDFFYSMNAGSGKNLNWFWKRWFFEPGYPDLAIGTVTRNRLNTQVKIISKGSKPVPVDLQVVFEDGSTTKIHRSIAVWEKGNDSITLTVPGNKKIRSLLLGSTYVPDINKADNRYPARQPQENL